MSFLNKVESISLDEYTLKHLKSISFQLYQEFKKTKVNDPEFQSRLKKTIDYLAKIPEILTGKPDSGIQVKF